VLRELFQSSQTQTLDDVGNCSPPGGTIKSYLPRQIGTTGFVGNLPSNKSACPRDQKKLEDQPRLIQDLQFPSSCRA
jgi:hypothetical protein